MVEEFKNAIASSGISPPANIIADGKLHRFHVEGDKPRSENGWYILHEDPPAGAFGCWKRGISETWSCREHKTFTPEEKARHNANMEAQKRQRKEEQARVHAECRERSYSIWQHSEPAPANHPYLVRKGVRAHGLRQYQRALVVPVRGADGILHGLQFISAEKDESGKDKRFKSGTDKTGHYHGIGGSPETVLYLAEGYATAATVFEATGDPVAVCFDAGNLKSVAQNLRQKFPDIKLIICGDDDKETDGNPGRSYAVEAARAVSGNAVFPSFPDGVTGTDFNDLAVNAGLDEVTMQIESFKNETVVEAKELTLDVVRGSEINPEPIEWLWPGWLAAGKFHVMAGAPGTGKTTIALSLAAILSRGGMWPDGSHAPIADIAIWSGEDDIKDTLAPRLIAAGADMEQIHFIQGTVSGDEKRPFDPASDLSKLRLYLADNAKIKLLIVDPVVSAVSGDSHKNTEVRRNLQPLVDLAQACGVAVLGISHFSKGTSGKDPVERVTGSIAFGAVARIVLATAKVENDGVPEGTRLFVRAKSNIGSDTGGWYYRLSTIELEHFNGVFTSEILWGDAVEGSARELLATAETSDDGEKSAIEEAKEFLRTELVMGPVSVNKIFSEAKANGLSERTLKRAKKDLGIKSDKGGYDSGWQWEMPSKSANVVEEGHIKTVAPFREFGTLRDSECHTDSEIFSLSESDFFDFDEEVSDVG